MKKILPICMIVFSITIAHAQERKDYDIIPMNVTCIDIGYYSTGYPVMFYVAIQQGDSIKIDTSSYKGFVESILSQSMYLPYSQLSLIDTYKMLWGNYNFHQICMQYEIDTFDQIEKLSSSKTVKIENGDTVFYRSVDISGLFMVCKKDQVYPMGELSISLNYMDYPEIDRLWFPIFATNIQRSKTDPFVIVPTEN